MVVCAAATLIPATSPCLPPPAAQTLPCPACPTQPTPLPAPAATFAFASPVPTLSPTTPTNCTIPTAVPPSAVCHVITVPGWKQSYGMEQVWEAEFQRLFAQYLPHLWYLAPVLQKPTGTAWNTFVDSAKVRFCCEDCGHGWTSMKGRVAFWFTLNPVSREGLVAFKLFGQQCEKCKGGRYEPAMWYPEEVLKVLVNAYNRVGQVYYGFYQPPMHKNRRPGKPRNPHNSELCQACRDGVCAERK